MYGNLWSLLLRIQQSMFTCSHSRLSHDRWLSSERSNMHVWECDMYEYDWVNLLFDVWRWVLSEDGLR